VGSLIPHLPRRGGMRSKAGLGIALMLSNVEVGFPGDSPGHFAVAKAMVDRKICSTNKLNYNPRAAGCATHVSSEWQTADSVTT